mmetsp:Transcript_20486/g.42789  ORF Transcript_20486/g.42789 Transcript_20486/m.42789 type:complete len:212 (-) Transcript_20486:338-973(-)
MRQTPPVPKDATGKTAALHQQHDDETRRRRRQVLRQAQHRLGLIAHEHRFPNKILRQQGRGREKMDVAMLVPVVFIGSFAVAVVVVVLVVVVVARGRKRQVDSNQVVGVAIDVLDRAFLLFPRGFGRLSGLPYWFCRRIQRCCCRWWYLCVIVGFVVVVLVAVTFIANVALAFGYNRGQCVIAVFTQQYFPGIVILMVFDGKSSCFGRFLR